ncbi:polysaccharide deacetylase family protein [Streptomyces sp. NBC_00045]|uniref:polysaccharide deacetylase family protein n=1 Tax=Streptomyces sp. NBC_00045 TaxID=2975625 RepID=UPI0032477143
METRSLAVVRALVHRRLRGGLAGLCAALWVVAPGPTAMTAEAAPPRPAAAVEEEGLRSLFASENGGIRTSERVVAVPFNAAWNDAGLDGVLDELARRHAPATFFLTGDFADRFPEVVKRIAAAGDGLGNHSYSHPSFKDLTAAGRSGEVRAANRALRTAGAGEALTPYFRFPYGKTSPAHIAGVNALGFADIEFTTDTNGWMGTEGGMTVDRAVSRALDALRPGAILQMHVGASRTVPRCSTPRPCHTSSKRSAPAATASSTSAPSSPRHRAAPHRSAPCRDGDGPGPQPRAADRGRSPSRRLRPPGRPGRTSRADVSGRGVRCGPGGLGGFGRVP